MEMEQALIIKVTAVVDFLTRVAEMQSVGKTGEVERMAVVYTGIM